MKEGQTFALSRREFTRQVRNTFDGVKSIKANGHTLMYKCKKSTLCRFLLKASVSRSKKVPLPEKAITVTELKTHDCAALGIKPLPVFSLRSTFKTALTPFEKCVGDMEYVQKENADKFLIRGSKLLKTFKNDTIPKDVILKDFFFELLPSMKLFVANALCLKGPFRVKDFYNEIYFLYGIYIDNQEIPLYVTTKGYDDVASFIEKNGWTALFVRKKPQETDPALLLKDFLLHHA